MLHEVTNDNSRAWRSVPVLDFSVSGSTPLPLLAQDPSPRLRHNAYRHTLTVGRTLSPSSSSCLPRLFAHLHFSTCNIHRCHTKHSPSHPQHFLSCSFQHTAHPNPPPPPPEMDEVPQPNQLDEIHRRFPEMARSDSSGASSDGDAQTPQILAPVPVRPRLPSRKSSGTIIVPRDSVDAVEPTETWLDPRDVRAMSPRRTSEDLEALGREARDELRR